MKKTLLFFALILCFFYSYSQEKIGYPKDSTKLTDEIYTVVEEMPQYPGGDAEMHSFINKNIQYPNTKFTGTVYIRFLVTKTGALADFKILRGVSGDKEGILSQEAIRVLQLMPKWNPGKQNGKIVNVQYILPIKFALQ